MSKILNDSTIDQFLQLKFALPKQMFINNMKKQLPNYKLNMKFLKTFYEYLGDWVSYSDISDDTIEYLIDNNLFDYNKWSENSDKKTKNLFLNKKFQTKYSENISYYLTTLKNISYSVLKYFLQNEYPDETKYNLLYNYTDTEDITEEYIKYANLLGTYIFRERNIREHLLKGDDLFDKTFLTDNSIDIFLLLDTVAYGTIPENKINEVFNKNKFCLSLFFKNKEIDEDDDNYKNILNMLNNTNLNNTLPSSYNYDEDESLFKSKYSEYYEKLDNIRERYGLQIYYKFIMVINSVFPALISDKNFLLSLLKYQIPEKVLASIYNLYINNGLYSELEHYVNSNNLENIKAILLLNQE